MPETRMTSRQERGGPSRETAALMQRRREELRVEEQRQEQRFVQGRWVTDPDALVNKEAKRREQISRRVPKRVAHVSLYNTLQDPNTGIETEAHEVVDRVSQRDLVNAVDGQTQRKKFDLVLDKLGPYKIDFTINGTHLLLAGLRGHLANIRWQNFALNGEVQLKDKINDATFLVDHTMTAVAQRKYVYMYTKEGTEMHLLSKLANMDRLGYLPKHLLLAATSSVYSTMQYLDISTGVELGAKVPSVMRDPTSCLAVNGSNGVVATCNPRGVVKFWSPSVLDPLVQLRAHKGVIEAIRFHPAGRFFVTLGGDHKLKVWDCRTLRALEEYAVTYCFDTLDISSSGLVALGGGTNVQIWKDMFTAHKPNAPYMKFGLGYGNIATQVRFCPFEDVLGVGHARGFSSLLVPASGEANPDIYYANPYETERHRKERVVTTLLDKLPPDTISMDIQVPGVNEERLAEYKENLRLNRKAMAIRAKKERRANRALGAEAPTGLLSGVGNDEEVDEELGYKERPVTRQLKTRQEKAAEQKAQKWDKKDSADKVRSKQTMRQSRLVQKLRARRSREERDGAYDRDDLDGEEATALRAQEEASARETKRRRRMQDVADGDIREIARPTARRRDASSHATVTEASSELLDNAAFKRFM